MASPTPGSPAAAPAAAPVPAFDASGPGRSGSGGRPPASVLRGDLDSGRRTLVQPVERGYPFWVDRHRTVVGRDAPRIAGHVAATHIRRSHPPDAGHRRG